VDERPKEFFILFLLLVAGVAGTFVARDLFLFLLCYEVVVIPIYIMIILWGSSKRVTKEYAAMKLTIYLLLGSAFLLAGILMLYLNAYPAGTRTFSMEALTQAAAGGALSPEFQKFAFFFVMLGFGSLLSMWPFHSWSPDGYAGAPTAVSMVHAGVLKKIGGYGLIRIGLLMLPLGFKFWAPLIAAFGVANVAYAAFIALVQKDMKYVVGYSSVSHMGYVLIGIAAADVIGINGAVANMFAHGVMAALFFAMIGHIYHATHTRHIPDLGGLAHQMPRATVGFFLAGMASLGLPGLISFVPEFTIFVGSFKAFPLFAVLAIAGIILTALYVLRVLADVLFGPRRSEWDGVHDLHGADWVPLVVLGSFLIGFGFFPSLLMNVVNSGIEPLMPLLAKLKLAATLWGGL
jgi:NADH-quinone oxidoreductase subunit M